MVLWKHLWFWFLQVQYLSLCSFPTWILLPAPQWDEIIEMLIPQGLEMTRSSSKNYILGKNKEEKKLCIKENVSWQEDVFLLV